MNVIPLLADNYKISNEGKTIEIKLRDSGKWHDQRGLTSYDVAFTLDTIKASNKEGIYGQIFETAFGAFHPYNIHNVIRVNIIDELNFEIIFDRSYSSNLESLTLPIIPKHIFEEEGIRGALELEKYNPIGTGPYKFEDYSDLTNVNLVKNEECWKGTLYINQIRGRVFRDEETIL
ncbi:MAG TPA: ABC transporter substrate-binding protein, partial [Tissierellales bacterium]|nr:ABC transporter substrate-binding protein [Tissierellales bacterium]